MKAKKYLTKVAPNNCTASIARLVSITEEPAIKNAVAASKCASKKKPISGYIFHRCTPSNF